MPIANTIPQGDKSTSSVSETRIAFRVPEKFNEKVRIAAVKRKMSIQQLCIEALTAYLKAEAA